MSEMFVQKKTWVTHTHNLENSGEIPMYQITCDYGITPYYMWPIKPILMDMTSCLKQ